MANLTVEIYEEITPSLICKEIYRWRIKAGNNRVIAVSPNFYGERADAKRAAKRFVKDVRKDDVVLAILELPGNKVTYREGLNNKRLAPTQEMQAWWDNKALPVLSPCALSSS